MKTKIHNRVLCGLMAFLMVFCLLPVSSAIVNAAGLSVGISYRLDDGSDRGETDDYVGSNGLEIDNPVAVMDCTTGSTFTPNIPQSPYTAKNGNTYTLSSVTVGVATRAPGAVRPTQSYKDFDLTLKTPVTIDENAIQVTVYYKWTVTEGAGSDDDTPETGRPSFTVENFISGVAGTVGQNGTALTPAIENGTEVYTVTENDNGLKSGITLTYNTEMDMRNLGIAGLDFDAAEDIFPDIVLDEDQAAWNLLVGNRRYITDETWVNLEFTFDSTWTEIDIKRALSNAYLQSDMFSLQNDPSDEQIGIATLSDETNSNRTYIRDYLNSYDISGNTVTIYCKWDSTKVQANMTAKGSLDPMIYFNGIQVDIKENWGELDTITVVNEGRVHGRVYTTDDIQLGDPLINGGWEEDSFVLTVEEEPVIPPEEDEPSTIIPDNGPTISIRKVWVEDTEEDRPDSILVEIYHDEELYDTVEVEEKYRWRTSYSIPERYENDDWWVQEADVPEGYEDYIDETRDNVFVITNTYVGVEEESSEESSEPSVTPSEPSVEPSEPSSEPSEPTPEPEEPAKPTLPQTGQVWWPIIILLAGGAVLVAFGAFRTIRGNGRRER